MAHRALADATTLRLETSGAKPRCCTWGEFTADNRDGDLDLLDIQDRLANAGRATIGGGAAPFTTIIIEHKVSAPARQPTEPDPDQAGFV